MKTVYYTSASLDGFIASEDDSLDWLFALSDINDTSYPPNWLSIGRAAKSSVSWSSAAWGVCDGLVTAVCR